MKFFLFIVVVMVVACNNSGSSRQTTDSATIHTNTGNVSDGGPNNGRGDTNSYDRMSNKITDTSSFQNSFPKK